jgi:hypothetical protein
MCCVVKTLRWVWWMGLIGGVKVGSRVIALALNKDDLGSYSRYVHPGLFWCFILSALIYPLEHFVRCGRCRSFWRLQLACAKIAHTLELKVWWALECKCTSSVRWASTTKPRIELLTVLVPLQIVGNKWALRSLAWYSESLMWISHFVGRNKKLFHCLQFITVISW